jgi:hypothetical protein
MTKNIASENNLALKNKIFVWIPFGLTPLRFCSNIKIIDADQT